MINPFIETLVSIILLMNMTELETVNYVDDIVNEMIHYEVRRDVFRLDQIIRYKRGDCSEKAILSKAILKELNFKPRGRTGSFIYPKPPIVMLDDLYFRNETHMGYRHAWVEVKIDGEWIQTDRTSDKQIYIEESRTIR